MNPVKTIGILGGLGPESTVDYYRLFIRRFQERDKSGNYPHILLNSINLTEMIGYVAEKQFDLLIDFLVKEIHKLELAGADIGILAANTPHIVFDEVQKRVSLPLLSIVEEVIKTIKRLGFSRTGLLGTRFTMQGGFYQLAADRVGIEIIVPNEEHQNYVHSIYMNELIPGIIRDSTKAGLLEIIENLRQNKNIEGLILGGTELSLILKQEDFQDFEIFDTAQIHVESVLDYMSRF